MKNISLKAKITLFSTLIILLIGIIVVFSSRVSQLESHEQYNDLYLSAKETLWNKIASSEAVHIKSGMSIFTRERKIIKAVRKGDKEALQESAWAAFRALVTSEIAYKAFLLNAQGEVIFSRTSKGADILEYDATTFAKHPAILKTVKDGKSRYGLARENGGIDFIFTFPLYARGKLKGVGVYASKIERSLNDFKASSGTEAALFVGNSIISSTNKSIFENLKIDLDQLKTERIIRQTEKGKEFSLSITSLKGADDAIAANLVTLEDRTDYFNKLDSILFWQYFSFIIAFTISIACIYLFMHFAFKPLKHAIIIASDVNRNNDLTLRLPTDAPLEIQQIAIAFNSILEAFDEIVIKITNGVNKAQDSSNIIESNSKELQAKVANQNKETNLAATAVTEMSAAIQEVAQNAAAVYESTNSVVDKINTQRKITTNTATNSQELNQQMLEGSNIMQKLHQDSMNIGTVLEVIRGIAEQTNLLALNAAIEAARAGEQGRGFAVVADEVRGLASRTAQSTEDIQNMVESLQDMAEQAVKAMTKSHEMSAEVGELANDAMGIQDEIHVSAKNLANMNQHINVATEEQSAVAEEINRSIVQISDISEANDRTASDTLNSIVQISQEIKDIYNLIEKYKT